MITKNDVIRYIIQSVLTLILSIGIVWKLSNFKIKYNTVGKSFIKYANAEFIFIIIFMFILAFIISFLIDLSIHILINEDLNSLLIFITILIFSIIHLFTIGYFIYIIPSILLKAIVILEFLLMFLSYLLSLVLTV